MFLSVEKIKVQVLVWKIIADALQCSKAQTLISDFVSQKNSSIEWAWGHQKLLEILNFKLFLNTNKYKLNIFKFFYRKESLQQYLENGSKSYIFLFVPSSFTYPVNAKVSDVSLLNYSHSQVKD